MNLFFTEPLGSVRRLTRCALQNRTLIMIMRISCLNICLLICSFNILSASPASGQGLENIKVNLEFNNESLKNVFERIEKKTGLLFAYPHEKVNIYTNVSLPKGRYTVKEALDLVLDGTPLKYSQTKKHIIVFLPISETGNEEAIGNNSSEGLKKEPLFSVTGKVTDSEGTPMPAVNVVVKGTTKGTATDTEGHYEIEAGNKDVLVFSFIGYKAFETQVNERTVIDITMKEDVRTLEEVQINGGYYTTTQATSTGNIARITNKEISGQPVSNSLQALQGRMPGVEIIQTNGVPGAAMKIQIRGQNSLRPDGNYPLYIIDGVPVISTPLRSYGRLSGASDPLNTINPENIESIEVLKDADATAIYGSRGANGVVLITTKKGKAIEDGKTNLDVSFYSGAGKANQIDGLMDSKQYLKMRREAYANDGTVPSEGDFVSFDLIAWDTTRQTDWQDKLFGGTANTTDAQIALSTGSERTSFRFGTGYHKETMVFPGDFGYQRASGNLNVNHKTLNEKLNVTASINYSVDNNRLLDGGMVNDALLLAPVAPALYDENGNLNWEIAPLFGGIFNYSTWKNPLSSTLRKQSIKAHNLIINSTLKYEILPGLNLGTNLGYTSLTSDEVIKTPLTSFAPTLPDFMRVNSTALTNRTNRSWIVEPQLRYAKDIGSGKLDVLIGSTWQERRNNNNSVEGSGYPSDGLLGSLEGATLVTLRESSDIQYRYTAFFGRIGYNWMGKYLVNLTGRRDGSSRFGPENRFANFGAVGLGWVFSNEAFVENSLPFLSFGKLRMSYGTTGNDQIGDYGYLDSHNSTTFTYQGIKGLYPSALYNPNYKWEVNKKLEAGLELGIMEDKVLLYASWYRNRSSNQLVGYPLPKITGFSSVFSNLEATVENTGLEFLLNTVNIESRDFKWSSSINLTIPRNKLVSYPGIEASSYKDQYVVGESLSILRLLNMTGVDPQTGLYQFEDVNEDGNYSIEDKYIIKDLARKYYGGIANNFSYKGFDLSFFFEFVKQDGGNQFYLFGMPGTGYGFSGAQPTSVLNRWQVDGDITNTQKFTQSFLNSTIYFNATESNAAISDASFIRLKNISLAYTFPTDFIKKIGLKECKMYVQGQNLWTMTNYIGLDAQNPGVNNLPALKMFTGGFQFTF